MRPAPTEPAGENLVSRIATSALLVPPVVAGVLWLPTVVVVWPLAILLLLAAGEWTRMMAGAGWYWRAAFYLLLGGAGIVPSLWLAVTPGAHQGLQVAIAALTACWWLAAAAWVACYPAGLAPGRPLYRRKLGVGLLIIVPAAWALAGLHGYSGAGPKLVLILLLIVWAADTGAYVAGRRFGRHRLAPAVSPGKTWEGALGGMVAGVTAGMGGALLLGAAGTTLALSALVSAAVVVASIVGDLTISMFKRQSQVKDTGRLLPGHGGLLDRIDSLLAAAPVFLLGVQLARLWP